MDRSLVAAILVCLLYKVSASDLDKNKHFLYSKSEGVAPGTSRSTSTSTSAFNNINDISRTQLNKRYAGKRKHSDACGKSNVKESGRSSLKTKKIQSKEGVYSLEDFYYEERIEKQRHIRRLKFKIIEVVNDCSTFNEIQSQDEEDLFIDRVLKPLLEEVKINVSTSFFQEAQIYISKIFENTNNLLKEIETQREAIVKTKYSENQINSIIENIYKESEERNAWKEEYISTVYNETRKLISQITIQCEEKLEGNFSNKILDSEKNEYKILKSQITIYFWHFIKSRVVISMLDIFFKESGFSLTVGKNLLILNWKNNQIKMFREKLRILIPKKKPEYLFVNHSSEYKETSIEFILSEFFPLFTDLMDYLENEYLLYSMSCHINDNSDGKNNTAKYSMIKNILTSKRSIYDSFPFLKFGRENYKEPTEDEISKLTKELGN